MAAADVAKLVASLELKDNLSKGIASATAGVDKLEGKFGKIGSAASRGIGTAVRTVKTLGLALAAAAAAAGVGIVFKSIQAASDLNETISKVGVVFGAATDQVIKFGDTSAAAIGLSKNAALSAAATYGNLFVSMGLTAQKSADMSTALVKLAGDLASFNNLDPTEVTEKLRAGLTGESEPLKSLGININETIIKAKALELGLIKTGASTADLKLKTIALNAAHKAAVEATKKYGANSQQALKATVAQEKAQAALESTTKKIPATLDAATKAQAAYALIFEQSATAQGDFSRTSSGLANQQRILRANLDNISATIGTALLPKVAQVVQKINDFVVKSEPAIASLAAQLPVLFDAGMAFVEGIPWDQVASGLQVAASAVGALFKVFASMPPQVQATIVALGALNKLSGGAVSSIVSELGKGLIKGVLGINAGVVNVNGAVVNGGGGLPAVIGAKGGLGVASRVFLVGEAIGLALLVNDVRQGIADGNTQQSRDIMDSTNRFLAQSPKAADIQNALSSVDAGIRLISDNPLNVLVQGDALDNLKKMRVELQQALAEANGARLTGNLGRPGPMGGVTPRGSILPTDKTQRQNLAEMAILQRAIAKGFRPSQTAVTNTYNRDVARAAQAQVTQAKRAADAARATTAAIKDGDSSIVAAINRIPGANVSVNVTASDVSRVVVNRLRAVKNRNPRTAQTGASEFG